VLHQEGAAHNTLQHKFGETLHHSCMLRTTVVSGSITVYRKISLRFTMGLSSQCLCVAGRGTSNHVKQRTATSGIAAVHAGSAASTHVGTRECRQGRTPRPLHTKHSTHICLKHTSLNSKGPE
jgi:hypothetical protein